MTGDTASKPEDDAEALGKASLAPGDLAHPDSAEQPPFMSPEATRKMTVAVVVMGVILVLGFAALIAGLIYRSADLAQGSRKSASPQVATASSATAGPGTRSSQFYRDAVPSITHTDVPVPPGARITHVAVEGDRATITLAHAGGTSLLVVDTQSGKVLRTFGFTSSAAPSGN